MQHHPQQQNLPHFQVYVFVYMDEIDRLFFTITYTCAGKKK